MAHTSKPGLYLQSHTRTSVLFFLLPFHHLLVCGLSLGCCEVREDQISISRFLCVVRSFIGLAGFLGGHLQNILWRNHAPCVTASGVHATAGKTMESDGIAAIPILINGCFLGNDRVAEVSSSHRLRRRDLPAVQDGVLHGRREVRLQLGEVSGELPIVGLRILGQRRI